MSWLDDKRSDEVFSQFQKQQGKSCRSWEVRLNPSVPLNPLKAIEVFIISELWYWYAGTITLLLPFEACNYIFSSIALANKSWENLKKILIRQLNIICVLSDQVRCITYKNMLYYIT